MSLAAIAALGRRHDIRAEPDQAALTRDRLLPAMSAIAACLLRHRAAVDAEFFRRRDAARASGEMSESDPAFGEISLAAYPVGFCRQIRDAVWERAVADAEFRQLVGPEVLLRRIFVLLKGRYFQNAAQLGNLYVDVANDTVWIEKPKLEWTEITDLPYENLESWPRLADVARRYLGVTLYPNLLFPLAFPIAPYFAVRPCGRVDLFFVQTSLFYKDLADGLSGARALLAEPTFAERRLPSVYEERIRASCGGNLRDAFPLEFAPSEPAEIIAGALDEFAKLTSQPPAHLGAMLDAYLKLVAGAAARLQRLNLVPPPEELARLRAEGAVPPSDASHGPPS
jgi:hypothetical protein